MHEETERLGIENDEDKRRLWWQWPKYLSHSLTYSIERQVLCQCLYVCVWVSLYGWLWDFLLPVSRQTASVWMHLQMMPSNNGDDAKYSGRKWERERERKEWDRTNKVCIFDQLPSLLIQFYTRTHSLTGQLLWVVKSLPFAFTLCSPSSSSSSSSSLCLSSWCLRLRGLCLFKCGEKFA